MGIALIKMKIMPTSPEADLEAIKKSTKKAAEKLGAKNCSFEEQEIAFGLKAIIFGFAIDEDKGLDPVEDKIKKIEEVSSVQVIDMRRDFV